jgi:hypothetical protein
MKTLMSSFRFFLPVPDLSRKGMPLSNRILLLLVLCLLALAGCVVEGQEPVGEAPASINPQEWEGTWVSHESDAGTRVLQIVDAPQGILLMKMKQWNKEKKQEEDSLSYELFLRQSGDWLFASWKEADAPTFAWWGRIENRAMEDRGRVLLLWLPNSGKIISLVKEGLLPGQLVGEEGKERLVLGQLMPEHYQGINP